MSDEPPHDPLHEYVIGYPKLAARMGLKPETAIFRKFSALNARNLLYMQAELARLEDRLHIATYFPALANSEYEDGHDQLQLVKEIRALLKDYNEALLQCAQLNKIAPPDGHDISDIQHYLGSKQMGSLALEGDDAFTWGSVSDPKSFQPDIITLKEREKDDAFSKWVAESATSMIGCFGRWKKKSRLHGEVVIYDSSILRATFWTASIFASLLPIASILVLTSLHTLQAKLGTIAAFNVLTSVCLTILTDVGRSDIFAVTAAFAAVQVVFIGTNEDGCCGA